MEINVGVDIIEIERFKEISHRYKERFFKKIFTDEEMKYIKGDILKMCISFSLKESIWKSLPEEIQKKILFKDIKIGWNNNPFLLQKIENFKVVFSYSINEKYIITVVLLIEP